LINNRQGGRRRGRGGQGSGGRNIGGGQPGNRQDNRQRGNAAQLLEKYKAMARDSQLAGDRVQTEYYLQYADHYFRVLGESRSRFEDQRPRRDQDMDEDEGDNDEEMVDSSEDEALAADDRTERPEREEGFNRRDKPRRPPERDEPRAARPERSEQMNGEPETIPFDVLPPAIGRDDGDSGESEPKRPRRRARAARPAETDDDIAPVA
jgi:hypothetical protein